MYFKSTNYGGVLQAYALQELLNQYPNVSATQIKYNMNSGFSSEYSSKKVTFKKIIKLMHRKQESLLYKKNRDYIEQFRNDKIQKFQKFDEKFIKSSELSYSYEELYSLNKKYDYFICGSDQVWHSINYGYLLDFVENPSGKISYAASIARTSLSRKEKEKISSSLETFNAISVREASDIFLLKSLTKKEIIHVLDPTLLLPQNSWKNICSPKIHKTRYILCYFLGNNKVAKRAAYSFAKSKGLDIVIIPANITDLVKKHDNAYSYNASPQEFLSLIKNAEFVFTDSYHCTIFSIVFQKQFFVYRRNRFDEMINRVKDLMSIFNIDNRLCPTNAKLNYLNSLQAINYVDKKMEIFNVLKKNSIKFLETRLQIKAF